MVRVAGDKRAWMLAEKSEKELGFWAGLAVGTRESILPVRTGNGRINLRLGKWVRTGSVPSKSMSHFSTPVSGIEQAMGSDSGMDKSRVSTVEPKAGVPGPAVFPLSLPELPWSQRPVFLGPNKNLGPKWATWG